MSSPTIMAELARVRRTLQDPTERWWYSQFFKKGQVEAALQNPLRCFLAELPQRRYEEDMEREFEAQEAAGDRTVCPKCGERSVVDGLVATLGGGLPGSEYSVYYKCERDDCDYEEL
jgi:predicted nucleic-acid-binding Zn-ribbon protein